ncbi:MAG: hypothetical protein WBW16_00510 [Bacteroidota bacterium]
MSLKVFHIIFISFSVVLAFGFGLWLFMDDPEEGGVLGAFLSFCVGSLLVLYEIRIVKKFRSLKNAGAE